MEHRIERFSSTLKHTLADIIINDIQDPRLKTVTITDLTITPDLKRAHVFIASAVEEDGDQFLAALDKAKGFIKKRLSQKMYLKYIPELLFVKDDRRRMDQLLDQAGELAT